MMQQIRQHIPQVQGPLSVSADSYPFSTMAHANEPLDLSEYGYVEEEYLLEGDADTYSERIGDDSESKVGTAIPDGRPTHYVTRVLVRRPVEETSQNAWLSILNASQGYDIEDDWRRAWDYIIAQRDCYVGVTSKPINADALHNFDGRRYARVTWGGKLPGLHAEPGWNPFQIIPGSEEGLAWDILAQAGAWVRSGSSFPAPNHVVMMGQSQSAVYTNTYLTYFDSLLTGPNGERIFDGYLPGAGSVLCRELRQMQLSDSESDPAAAAHSGAKATFVPRLLPPAQIEAPVITITTEADTHLFAGLGSGAEAFMLGDGPKRRHWHVAGVPHSDARSRVIPCDSEILKAGRLPRNRNEEWLRSLITLPVEPVITAAMSAIVQWIDQGIPAPDSAYFDTQTRSDDRVDVRDGSDGFASGGRRFVNDAHGNRAGGIRLGMLEHPIADFHPAALEQGVSGTMTLHDATQVKALYPTYESYQHACDEIDDRLQAEGYLEAHGRRLLHNVEAELWRRCVEDSAPLEYTPQEV
ncbi:hypothetical protein JS532_04785 [Bifidobacterium callimiconis]|uniref:alpha/beta hydrolase domain-containing protein n=1 Tax=Bifidobacterium callimiconis TaxID=2306973 RepID=UPI001BDD8D9F|nr:alpha/beta hydrolase domain-containing protein [Bifidobacterium callimiconis]MBT1176886.1 hypothetical protein [Bifidobacterium callimiconis]